MVPAPADVVSTLMIPYIKSIHPLIFYTVANLAANPLRRSDALHLLEHLESAQTEPVVINLWRLTARLLIVPVPLETVPNPR